MRADATAARTCAQREYPNRYDDDEVIEHQADRLWNSHSSSGPYRLVLLAINQKGQEFMFPPRSRDDVEAFLRRFDRWHYTLKYDEAVVHLKAEIKGRKIRIRPAGAHIPDPDSFLFRVPYSVDLDELLCWQRPDDEFLFYGIPLTGEQVRKRKAVPVADNDWHDIVRTLRAPVRQYMGPCADGNRAKTCYRIAKTLAECGASGPEIARVVKHSGAWRSKTAEQGERWGQQELARLSKLGK